MVVFGACHLFAVFAAAEDGPLEAPAAIDGYDLTVFFSRGAAIRGSHRNIFEYEGSSYLFRTEANKKEFAESPFRFLPQYDGYDAYGIFLGEVVKADPRLWSVEDGRLFLFSTAVRRDAWQLTPDRHRTRADNNWPSIKIGLARAEELSKEEAERAAAAATQNCGEIFLENYQALTRHKLIVDGCAPSAGVGNASNAVLLARVYAERYSPFHDYSKAAELLQFAVAKGNESARWRLGDLYADGKGVPKDPNLAFKLYKTAAERGLTAAMLRLARNYRDGVGVERDRTYAWAWYNIASNRSAQASHERGRLERKMTATELDGAQLLTIALLRRLKIDNGDWAG